MDQPYWEKLLIRWREIGRDGLTVPFIIGSQQYLKTSQNEQGIADLIVSIIEDGSEQVYLKYCMNLEDLILGIWDESKNRITGQFPKYKSDTQHSLYLTSGCSDLGDSIEKIIISLEKRHEQHIDNYEFSKNGRERGDYTGEEKKFIRECFEEL